METDPSPSMLLVQETVRSFLGTEQGEQQTREPGSSNRQVAVELDTGGLRILLDTPTSEKVYDAYVDTMLELESPQSMLPYVLFGHVELLTTAVVGK
jgi:hypothetical protein